MQCAERLSGSLTMAGASVEGIAPETKAAVVSYDPAKTTLHQLIQTVADTESVHAGARYQAGLLITVEEPEKATGKLMSALKRVRGVTLTPLRNASSPGDMAITFAPLRPQAKASEYVRAAQIVEAVEKSGVKVSGLEGVSSAALDREESESKRKSPGTKGSAKSKSGASEEPEQKAKPSRPFPGGSRTKPTRNPSPPSTQGKEHKPEETPRFQILAGSAEKVFLADNEANLKKTVQSGDEFGDFVVKEIGDKDGLYVVLEHATTKEQVRVEKDRKEKSKEKSKEENQQ